ncbi:hypothetical protein [uncultured Psychrosphaera sp.]|uniref:hypothetical protein n=1 Tax=uncultured Psychrosphaera sp. TaxID=1403522 RepID=UPI00260B5654|nr:hypothetical protein [uncultured Psychrosphaera sp.]
MKYISVIVFFGAFLIISFLEKPKSKFDTELLFQAEIAAKNIPLSFASSNNQQGVVTYLSDGFSLSEYDMQEAIRQQTSFQHHVNQSLIWKDSFGNDATMTTFGLDQYHHFVNSYLVGIRPFEAENDWLPLYVIAQRKSYQLDQKQYGFSELWQNSAQAFKSLRGDCEDHAIALADWLISEGVDARVAIGKYEGGGHAWVVAFKNSQAFLLEATSKRVGKSWSHYPLASLAKGYQASYMFNRDTLWKSLEGYTNEYKSSSWQELSRFSKSI